MTVYVVGSLNQDVFLGVPALPAPGETVASTSMETAHGGKGLNQAVAAALAGAAVKLVGAVGADPAGQDLREFAQSKGVDTTNVSSREDPTGTAHILRAADGANCIVITAGANDTVGPDLVGTALADLGPRDVVVVQGEIPVKASERAISAAITASARVVLNLAPVVAYSPQFVAVADPLVVNEVEAAAMIGAAEPVLVGALRADRDRLAALATSVVITLGADGAVVLRGPDETHFAAPVASRVVDTTGAGDAFVGVLAARLASGADLSSATASAILAATDCVSRPGAADSYGKGFRSC